MTKIEEYMLDETISYLRSEKERILTIDHRTYIKGEIKNYDNLGKGISIYAASARKENLFCGLENKMNLCGIYFTELDTYAVLSQESCEMKKNMNWPDDSIIFRSEKLVDLLMTDQNEALEFKKKYGMVYDHENEVRIALKGAARRGLKYVTADFDFGWTTAKNIKISTNPEAEKDYLEPKERTQEFIYKYVQPVSMKPVSYVLFGKQIPFRNFLPFISKITNESTVLYEHEVEIEHPLENKLFNLVIRYGKTGDKFLKLQILELMENAELDFSVRSGNFSILFFLLRCPYMDIELIKAVVERAAGALNNDIKESYRSHMKSDCSAQSKDWQVP